MLGVNAEHSELFRSHKMLTAHSKQIYKEAGNMVAVSNKSTPTEHYKKIDMSNAFKKNYSKTEVKCFNCQFLGHFLWYCPEPWKPPSARDVRAIDIPPTIALNQVLK